MAIRKKVVCYYRQLIGYPDIYGKTACYGKRPIPRYIMKRAPKDRLKNCCQVQVKSFGNSYAWINVPCDDILSLNGFKPINPPAGTIRGPWTCGYGHDCKGGIQYAVRLNGGSWGYVIRPRNQFKEALAAAQTMAQEQTN